MVKKFYDAFTRKHIYVYHLFSKKKVLNQILSIKSRVIIIILIIITIIVFLIIVYAVIDAIYLTTNAILFIIIYAMLIKN